MAELKVVLLFTFSPTDSGLTARAGAVVSFTPGEHGDARDRCTGNTRQLDLAVFFYSIDLRAALPYSTNFKVRQMP